LTIQMGLGKKNDRQSNGLGHGPWANKLICLLTILLGFIK